VTSFSKLFGHHRVMVILRGREVADAVAAAGRAWGAGVELVEVPIGNPEGLAALAAVVDAGGARLVGAGTVITVEQVEAAAAAGAHYTVAPGFDPDVLAASLAAGLPHLPGVATASEVQRAYAAGCRWVKVFPAGVLGPAWFRALRGPFPTMRYLATGGVAIEAARDYLAAGAQLVAFGAAATDPECVDQLAALVTATHPPAAP
jgi:2-dehydro-3-deoxyphosphogluconate aldolase / (4S)-4-hydroxy-2-oxoglutarate aldolase